MTGQFSMFGPASSDSSPFDSARTDQPRHKFAALFTSKTPEWNTPERISRMVAAFGDVGLDPCSNGLALVKARRVAVDGLSQPWTGHGLVWVNPPYGRSVIRWAEKFHRDFESPVPPDEAILLVAARTDTGWFHDHCWTADALVFIRGRVEFVGPATRRGRCPFPSALVYRGARVSRFVEIFAELGSLVTRESL